MASAPLVARTHALSRQFRGLLAALPPEDPLDPPPGTKNAPSFLFEVRVLLALLLALKAQSASLEVVKRNGKVVLARAPRPKEAVSYFRVLAGDRSLQLVHGAEVTDRYLQSRAPDLCLERGDSADTPSYKDVLAIWDAKLRGITGEPDERRITKQELAYFLHLVDVLQVPAPGEGPIGFLGAWPRAFQVSALISNGRRPSEPDEVLFEKAISIVERFEDADTAGYPTREGHVKRQTV